ncbi:OsmC family protein [Phytopseudomonas dryadis]|uniref:Peroxiredoxin n=1 Tax=Phytopseudomonas dryadis TaxID=2487520 RepID=A0A4Q9R9M9_9GAMM|nr:OsmC family protein [Pseudomonas dryadis]TBU97410.1 peroxiredoxin [Pseudomonas dryadis]
MSAYHATILWLRGEQAFLDNRYSRAHRWQFDGGLEVAASSSPHVVPLPMSDASAVDPEEAFVASLSSCHMLWFLSLAAKQGFQVDRYEDCARGTLARDSQGKLAMTEVVLRPRVSFGAGPQPDAPQLQALHHAAHEACFIANSVTSEVRCEPQWD